jgi:hypothetical protein
MMRSSLGMAILVVVPLAFVACGSDDDGGSNSNGGGAGSGGTAGASGQAGSGGTAGTGGGTGGAGGETGGTGGGTGGVAGEGGTGGSTQTFEPPTFTEQQITDTEGENARWVSMTDTPDGYALTFAHGDDATPGTYDLVVAKLDATGQLAWSTPITDLGAGRCSIASNSDTIAVVCTDSNGLGMVQLDLQGNANPVVQLSEQSPAGDLNITDSSLVWTGTEWGLAWSAQDSSGLVDPNGTSIFFARFDAGGTLQGSPIAVETATNTGAQPSLVWTGTGYAVSYTGSQSFDIKLARIDATGQLVGSPDNINGDGYSGQSTLAWNGTHFGVAWGDDRDNATGSSDIFFRLVDPEGHPVGDLVKLTTDGNCWDPSLVWTGEVFGVLWSWADNSSTDQPDMSFASLDAQGTLLGTQSVIDTWESAPIPTMVYANDTYAVAWHQIPDPFGGDTQPQVFFAVSP